MRKPESAFLKLATIPESEILKIVESRHHDPFQVLGRHALTDPKGRVQKAKWVVRVFLPDAQSVAVLRDKKQVLQLDLIHKAGFFEGTTKEKQLPDTQYQLLVKYADGTEERINDPYTRLPIISEYDLYLWGQGTHYQIYEKLGSHPLTVDGVEGYHFAVWAPSATRVSVVGEFNFWDGRRHQMRVLGGSGIWELFIPNLPTDTLYKFEIRTRTGAIILKTDPFANRTELRPNTASITTRINDYKWSDADWLVQRGKLPSNRDCRQSVYEVHLGSWRRDGSGNYLSYEELAHQLVDHCKDLGFSHIELLPVNEHPFDASWGYQVTGYYAPTSRFGRPEAFMYFVDYCHQNGIGVILDWVPAHFPKDTFALSNFDGTALFEHEDPRQGEHPDWGTKIFNYDRNEVRNFLVASAHFWLEKYHIDGIRVDAVASMLYLDYSREAGEWIPNKYGGRENLSAILFIRQFNESVYERFPGIVTIAEESTAWPGVSKPVYAGGLGFGMKWNMGWMHDMLAYFSHDPVHRKFHHNNLTFGLMYAFNENFVLPLSHDEVVHGKKSLLAKMPGSYEQQFSNLRLLYGLMWTYPGKKLLFMGSEFGQWNEWNADQSLDWNLLAFPIHQGLQLWVKSLNHLMNAEPALQSTDFNADGFEWIDFHDVENSVISYRRKVEKNADQTIIAIFNFTPVLREHYGIKVNAVGEYRVVLNSDSSEFGGAGQGSSGVLASSTFDSGDIYLHVTLPPTGCLLIKRIAE